MLRALSTSIGAAGGASAASAAVRAPAARAFAAAISAPLLPLRRAVAAVRSRSCCIVLADMRR